MAITSGGVNLNDLASTDGDVAYLKITGKNGSTYTYEMADVEDVLFMPDVLPIVSTWDTDGDANNDSITIIADNLDKAMKDADAENLDVGDFLGFLVADKTYSEDASAESYGKITSYTIDSSGNYIITYEPYSAADGELAIEAALDVYYSQDQQVTLSEDDITKIESEIKEDVDNSKYAQQAAGYIAAVMLESNNLTTVPDLNAVESRLSEIEPYILATGTSVQMDGKKVSVAFDKDNIRVRLNLNSKLEHLNGNGFNVTINIPFTVTIGSGDNTVQIDITAAFQEEIILRQNISTKRHHTGFMKYDYSLNASFEVGNYTGIGFTANIRTAGEEGPSMIAKLEEIMDSMKSYHEVSGVTTTGGTMEGLAEICQSVMESANDAWIDIVEVKLFENNGNAFLHIFCWQIKGTFVVSANLAVSLGMSFEYITQKQYNFSVRVKDRTSSNETIDIITPQYNFDFYVVGTIGIRAGIRLEMYVGLFSLKLDKIGITAEAGAYARLWGYFFYHLHWEQGAGKTENSAGAMFIEIGIYLDINFVAQLLSSSKLTWNPTIYSNEWPLWSAGEQQNIYAFKNGGTNYDLRVTRTFPLPSSTFDMKYMDLKSGEIGTVNKDSDEIGSDEQYFTVSFSNPDFSYDAATNTVTVGSNADGLGEETDMTITWKKASLAFSSMPIQKVIHITWSDPASVHCITFDSRGGTAVAPIMATPGTSINWPANPTKQGYTFAGWRSMYENDYSATVMPDLNPTRNICLRATWDPNEDTPYKVEHYKETLKGTYELAQVETKHGTTDGNTKAEAKNFDNYAAPWIGDIEQQTIAADGSTVVKIYYKLKTYKVTFDPNYRNAEVITRTYKHGEPLAVPTLALKGYIFDGWNKDFDEYRDGYPVAVREVTYYAQWEAMTLTAHFDTMGGSPAVEPVTFEYGEPISKPDVTLTRTGYTFEDWYEDPSCTRKFSFGHTTPEESIVLYAKWVPNRYKVNFDANGGNIPYGYESRTFTYGQPYGDLAKNHKAYRTGYAFLGWYTEAEGGERVNADTIVKITAPQTLYAHWEEGSVNYTVKHMQESVSGGSYSEVYDDTQTLTGKTNGTTAAEAKDYTGFTVLPFKQQTIAADGKTEVEIKYDRKKFTVNWVTDGDPLTGYYIYGICRYGTPITVPPTPTKTRTGHTYAFDGWYTAETGGEKVTYFGTVTKDVTYYARFTEDVNRYNVTYELKGGTNDPANAATYTYGVGLTLNDPTRTGYTFGGWFTDSSFSEESQVTAIGAEQTGNVTLYAKWTAIPYTLTLDPNGGTLAEGTDNPITVYYGDNHVDPLTPIRTGYVFRGWFTEANGGTEIEHTTVNVTGDLTLYAHWELETYTIKYFENGSEVHEPTTYTCKTGAELPTLSKTGYTFDGWFWNPNFTEASKVTEIAVGKTGSMTLYAKWTAKQHKVTFNANGGTLSEADASKTVTYGSTYGTLPTPTHSDKTAIFRGWFTAAEGGTKVESTTKVTGEENETLYARWSIGAVEYTHISINGEGIFAYPDTGKVEGYDDGSVKFDATNNILTLTDATITGTGLQFFAYNGKAPSIKLVGNNTVTCNEYDKTSSEAYAIYIDLVNGNGKYATFDGDGTLTVSVTDAAIGENTTSVAAIYGRTQYSYESKNYFGYMYIYSAAVEATVPEKVSNSVTAAGVMLGNGIKGNEGAEGGDIMFTGMTGGSLTAKGGTRAIYAYKVMNNSYGFVSATVSGNYDGSDPTTIPEGNSTYDISAYKYFTYTHTS